MLAFIESFNKIGSYMNVLERKKLKSRNHGIPERRNPGMTESRSFLVRYRRTYVLNNINVYWMVSKYEDFQIYNFVKMFNNNQ